MIANGDISSIDDALSALDASGAAGIMIGRAAIGRPWLTAQFQAKLRGHAYQTPCLNQRLDSLRLLIQDAVQLYGERTGVRVCRKHIAANLQDSFSNSGEAFVRKLQRDTCTIDSARQLIDHLKEIYSSKPGRAAA